MMHDMMMKGQWSLNTMASDNDDDEDVHRSDHYDDGGSWCPNGHRSRWHFLARASSSPAPVQILPVILQITLPIPPFLISFLIIFPPLFTS